MCEVLQFLYSCSYSVSPSDTISRLIFEKVNSTLISMKDSEVIHPTGILHWTLQDLKQHDQLHSLLLNSSKLSITSDIISRQFWNCCQMTLTMRIAWFLLMTLTFFHLSSNLKWLQRINSHSRHLFNSQNYLSAWLLHYLLSQINSISWTKSIWMFYLITSQPNCLQAKTPVQHTFW